jgi:transcriptional regulator with XRE-family HTH domain
MDGGIGAKLREARVQRGLDLAEVEAATKIQERFLRAIENEEWNLLPSEFYARSFIRSYAAHLGLDDAQTVEELRDPPSSSEPAERLPRIDPAPPQEAHSVRRRRLSPRFLATIATVGLAVVVVALALSSLGGDSAGPTSREDRRHAGPAPPGSAAARGTGPSLTLTATAEVWVCLLDERGRALIDGQILAPGSEQGPYRSGGFTLALGNGAVTIDVEGRQAPIPATPSPIGFSIDRHGALRELPEAQRPTCT